MRRRTFLGLGCALLAAPLAVEAQQAGKVYRIAYVTSQPLEAALAASLGRVTKTTPAVVITGGDSISTGTGRKSREAGWHHHWASCPPVRFDR
jgi:hypothetical protein